MTIGCVAWAVGILLTLAAATSASAQGEPAPAVAVESGGLASRYPGDVGMAADPAVVVMEDFEGEFRPVGWMETGGWFDFRLGEGMELAGTAPAAGKRCLQFNIKQTKQGSGAMMHLFDGCPEVFFRYYRRFAEDWVWPDGYGPHDAFVGGGSYSRPTDQDFEVLADFWRNGGTVARLASVRPPALKEAQQAWTEAAIERYGRPSVGGRPVPWNVSQPDTITPGEWHCVEVQIRLSAPGKSDGVLRMWVNGRRVTDFSDIPMVAEDFGYVQLNKVFIGPYFHPGSPKDQTHWVDQIVVAKEYIGPVAPVAKQKAQD